MGSIQTQAGVVNKLGMELIQTKEKLLGMEWKLGTGSRKSLEIHH